jgi:hypothetical protein
MLRTPVRHCRSKWRAGNIPDHQPGLRKCHTARDAGHGFPDSGLYRSEPRIIEVMGKAWRSWQGHWWGLLAVLVCIALTGCAGVSSGGQTTASNPANAGQISVAPAIMNFGSVALGSQATLTGTLTAGSSDINVTSAAWNGQGYNVSGITFPVAVAAGKSVTYTVTFSPQVSGASSGSVSFVNDGSTSPLVQTLDGSGGQAGLHTVGLSWDASTSSVIGYNVYRGTQSGGPYQLLTSSPQPDTSYADGTVLSSTTYYYVATSVDSSHAESIHSNEAQAVIP